MSYTYRRFRMPLKVARSDVAVEPSATPRTLDVPSLLAGCRDELVRARARQDLQGVRRSELAVAVLEARLRHQGT